MSVRYYKNLTSWFYCWGPQIWLLKGLLVCHLQMLQEWFSLMGNMWKIDKHQIMLPWTFIGIPPCDILSVKLEMLWNSLPWNKCSWERYLVCGLYFSNSHDFHNMSALKGNAHWWCAIFCVSSHSGTVMSGYATFLFFQSQCSRKASDLTLKLAHPGYCTLHIKNSATGVKWCSAMWCGWCMFPLTLSYLTLLCVPSPSFSLKFILVYCYDTLSETLPKFASS